MNDDDKLSCPIHLGVMNDPVSLQCGHNLCKTCATHIIRSNEINCPLCR